MRWRRTHSFVPWEVTVCDVGYGTGRVQSFGVHYQRPAGGEKKQTAVSHFASESSGDWATSQMDDYIITLRERNLLKSALNFIVIMHACASRSVRRFCSSYITVHLMEAVIGWVGLRGLRWALSSSCLRRLRNQPDRIPHITAQGQTDSSPLVEAKLIHLNFLVNFSCISYFLINSGTSLYVHQEVNKPQC